MQLHLHPTRREALTASYTAITRWSLETNPATILAQIANLPESLLPKLPDGRWNNFGGITTSPDGRLFAHEHVTPDLFWSSDPRVIEWCTWDEEVDPLVKTVRSAVLRATTSFSPLLL
jgi:hypothetical protein